MGEMTDAAQAAERSMADTAAAAQEAADAAHAAAGAAIAAASAPEPEPVTRVEEFPAHDHPHEHEGYAPSADVAAMAERLAALEGQVSAHLAEVDKPVEAEVTPVEPPKPEPERAPGGERKRKRLFGGLG